MSLVIPILIFLLSGAFSYFITRNFFLGIIGGILALMVYYGVISISFNWIKLLPSSLRGALQ